MVAVFPFGENQSIDDEEIVGKDGILWYYRSVHRRLNDFIFREKSNR